MAEWRNRWMKEIKIVLYLEIYFSVEQWLCFQKIQQSFKGMQVLDTLSKNKIGSKPFKNLKWTFQHISNYDLL